MTTQAWNPKAAAPLVAQLMEQLPHVDSITLTTCGGESLHALFNPDTCCVDFEDGEGHVIAKVKIHV